MASQNIIEIILRLKDETKSGLGAVDSLLGKITSSVFNLKSAFASLAAALGIREAVDDFRQFDDNMRGVAAVSGATGQEVEKLGNLAKDMGKSTRESAVTASGALLELAKAGITTEQQFKALPKVIDLASAGSLDLGRATEIAVNAMAGFGFKAEDLGRVNDVFAKAANDSTASVHSLAEGFKFVGSLTKSVGGNFEDLVAALGVLDSGGLKAEISGTALRGVLDSLYNPTSTEAKALEKLNEKLGGAGLQFKDAQGNFVGFLPVLKQLEAGGVDAAEAMNLFGMRAGIGIANLLVQGSAKLEQFGKGLVDIDGYSRKVSATLEGGIGGALRQLSSAFTGFKVASGESLANAFDPFLKKLTIDIRDVISWVEKLQKSGQLDEWGVRIAKAVESVYDSFKTLISVVSSAASFFQPLIAVLIDLSPIFVKVAAGAAALGTAFSVFSFIGSFAAPITALSMALVGMPLLTWIGHLSASSAIIGTLSVATSGWAAGLTTAGAALAAFFAGFQIGKIINEMDLFGMLPMKIGNYVELAFAKLDTFFTNTKIKLLEFMQGWQDLTGDTNESAAMQTRIDAEKRHIETINETIKTIESKAVKSEESTQRTNAAVKSTVETEKQSAAEIKQITDTVAQSRMSSEEKIRELKRRTMSESEQYADKVKQIEDTIAEAGRLAATDTEKSIALYKQAQDAAVGVGNAVRENGQEVVAQSDATAKATELIEKSQKGLETAANARKQALSESISNASQATDAELAELAELDAGIEEFEKALADDTAINIDTETAKKDVDDIAQKLSELGDVEVFVSVADEEALADIGKIKTAIEALPKEIEAEYHIKGTMEGSETKPISEKVEQIKGEFSGLTEWIEQPVNAHIKITGNAGNGEESASTALSSIQQGMAMVVTASGKMIRMNADGSSAKSEIKSVETEIQTLNNQERLVLTADAAQPKQEIAEIKNAASDIEITADGSQAISEFSEVQKGQGVVITESGRVIQINADGSMAKSEIGAIREGMSSLNKQDRLVINADMSQPKQEIAQTEAAAKQAQSTISAPTEMPVETGDAQKNVESVGMSADDIRKKIEAGTKMTVDTSQPEQALDKVEQKTDAIDKEPVTVDVNVESQGVEKTQNAIGAIPEQKTTAHTIQTGGAAEAQNAVASIPTEITTRHHVVSTMEASSSKPTTEKIADLKSEFSDLNKAIGTDNQSTTKMIGDTGSGTTGLTDALDQVNAKSAQVKSDIAEPAQMTIDTSPALLAIQELYEEQKKEAIQAAKELAIVQRERYTQSGYDFRIVDNANEKLKQANEKLEYFSHQIDKLQEKKVNVELTGKASPVLPLTETLDNVSNKVEDFSGLLTDQSINVGISGLDSVQQKIESGSEKTKNGLMDALKKFSEGTSINFGGADLSTKIDKLLTKNIADRVNMPQFKNPFEDIKDMGKAELQLGNKQIPIYGKMNAVKEIVDTLRRQQAVTAV